MQKNIDTLIINRPYEEPTEYWLYIRESQKFQKKEGRRRSGYWRSSPSMRNNAEDPGEFIEIPLVNQIRPLVKKWRKDGYPNVTGTTKKLLDYWQSLDRQVHPFWCQMEAIETAIWLTEIYPAEKQGIEIPSDGGEWQRQCLKLATGTGKTVVMAMIIVWQVLNKFANPNDIRFSSNILIVAPGLTVRDRLQVLLPGNEDNFYQGQEGFDLVDDDMWKELLGAEIIITNWHTLAPYDPNSGPTVVKKGAESDEAFVRRTLPDFGSAKNILVINDEAHHCHRPTGKQKLGDKATVWVNGLDKINRARGVLLAYDLSATPFKPTGSNNQGEQLFSWVVSDFGLNDAIESGLVKTPKVAVRDDSQITKELRSKFFHIYEHVQNDLNQSKEPHIGLDDLITKAVRILGGDWLQSKKQHEAENRKTPPVMIVICNRTETAARMEYSFKQETIVGVEELTKADTLLRIDQKALDEAESGKELVGSKRDFAYNQREKFNTVGKEGKPGEQVRCVIGVNMLSEGWDARTVTHILGLRAFTSQLLCEQVVGRGLRRISYNVNDDGYYEPEYVTVFGVPFTFLPVEGAETGKVAGKENPKTKIESLKDRKALKIDWPNVLRIEYKLKYFLRLEWDELKELILSPQDSPIVVGVAPVIDNHPNFDQMTEMDLDRLAEGERLESVKLKMAVQLHKTFGGKWEGDPGSHVGQLMPIIQEFFESNKLITKIPDLFGGAEKWRNILLIMCYQKIVNHIGDFIRSSHKGEESEIVFASGRSKLSTTTAATWYTSKPTTPVKKSQISHIVADSTWEGEVAIELELDRIQNLISWAKNDRFLGFKIYYVWQGKTPAYYPDFIIRFNKGRYLVLEVKGQKTEQDKAKWAAAEEWVQAVNHDGRFGVWRFRTLEDMSEIFNVIKADFDGVEED